MSNGSTMDTTNGAALGRQDSSTLRKRRTKHQESFIESQYEIKDDDDNTSRTDTDTESESEEEGEVNIVECFEGVQASEVLRYFLTSGVLPGLLNFTSKPWVLVPEGSFMGNCHWVPERFRLGPWHVLCRLYLAALTLMFFYEVHRCPPGNPSKFDFYDAYTPQWYYNAAGALWTWYVVVEVLKSNMGWTSWGMYTVWSWTFIAVRHLCGALAPFYPAVLTVNERLRFPTLVMSTLTFAVWNLVIGPSIYMQMKTDAMKTSFNRFFGSFHYKQMHVFNIVFAAVNGIWGSPKRELEEIDFVVSLGLVLLYAYFYLCVLDRLGVHYYLVFSPRTPWAVLSWTFLFGSYYAMFPIWKSILLKYA